MIQNHTATDETTLTHSSCIFLFFLFLCFVRNPTNSHDPTSDCCLINRPCLSAKILLYSRHIEHLDPQERYNTSVITACDCITDPSALRTAHVRGSWSVLFWKVWFMWVKHSRFFGSCVSVHAHVWAVATLGSYVQQSATKPLHHCN